MADEDPVVTNAVLTYAEGLFDLAFGVDGSARATLRMSDGTVNTFTWYHDELTFTAKDFMGKTMEQIQDLHYERDLAWLRSP